MNFLILYIYFLCSDLIFYNIFSFIFDYMIKSDSLISKKSRKLAYKNWFKGSFITYFILISVFKICNKNDYNYNIIYTFFSIILYYCLVDTSFYWVHRLAHSNYLYKLTHRYHHSFKPLSPWSARGLHWIDKNLEFFSFVLPIIIFPFYMPLIYFLLFFNSIWVAYLHTPNLGTPFKYLYDTYDHSIHHHYGQKNYNYAFYFKFWDKLMGTYKSSN